MRYLHGSTKVYAGSSDPEALVYWTKGYWTKVRPQIVTALGSAVVSPPQVGRETRSTSPTLTGTSGASEVPVVSWRGCRFRAGPFDYVM